MPSRQHSMKRPACAHPTEAGPSVFNRDLEMQGWTVVKKVRLTGEQQGQHYYLWQAPSGKWLRSMAEVKQHIAKGGS